MRYVRHLAGVVILAGTLSLGLAQQAAASSANVAALQVALKALGLYPVAVDGVKGPFTEKGVRPFQQQHRLLVDGVAGPQTRHALGRRGRPRLGSRVMHSGQRGWDVAALQFLLQRRGYPRAASTAASATPRERARSPSSEPPGSTVDGLAGSATLSLAASPVRRAHLPPSGPVSFYRPVPGPIGDRFGAPRENGRKHSGVDFPVAYGTLIEAAGVGTTVFAGYNSGGYGNLVVIQHRLGYTTWYAHMSRITSWGGRAREGGTRIGYVGSTGTRPAPTSTSRCASTTCRSTRCRTCWPARPRRRAGGAVKARCADPAAYATARIDDCR